MANPADAIRDTFESMVGQMHEEMKLGQEQAANQQQSPMAGLIAGVNIDAFKNMSVQQVGEQSPPLTNDDMTVGSPDQGLGGPR